jgi:deoxyribonuclease V
MNFRPLHPWKLTPKQAIDLQLQLVRKVVTENQLASVRYVAGADIAMEKDSDMGYAGVLVMTYPELNVVEQRYVEVKLSFPYIPGLLAFREAPVLLEAFSQVKHEPDLILVDGQGLAHPRRFGIASHLGLLLNKPTIGCAKSRLFGRHEEPESKKGSFADLLDKEGNVIGAVLRTRERTHPIYVSIGHKVDLPTAIRYTLGCCRGYRIPEPTRQADIYVGSLKAKPGRVKALSGSFPEQPGLLD